MMSTLQELLTLGLVDIGSDDSRFEKMKAASSALSGKFKEAPELLIPATLISLDEEVDEEDPMFSLVEDIVISEWKTLRNTHVNRPRELLRSIVIDALATTTVNQHHESAAIVWNSAASPLRHQQVRLGKAASLIENLLSSTGERVEREAVARAGMASPTPKKRGRKQSASSEKPVLKISAAIQDQEILADVARSVGPSHPQVPNIAEPNPHLPNAGHPWAHEFATRMATALSKAVSLGNARMSDAITTYLAEFEKQLTDQLRNVEQLQSDALQTQEAGRMRLDVLWWSEALYSPALNASYRELELPVAAVAAALDLADIVPPLAPASVCYVLGETLLRVSQLKDGVRDMPVQRYLNSIAETETRFFERLWGAPTNNARLPLVDLVGEAAKGSHISPETLRGRAGIDAALMLTPGDFAMWIFRGIQAKRLAETIR